MDTGRLIFDFSSSHLGGHKFFLGGGTPIYLGPRSVLGVEEGTSKRRPFFTSPDEMLEEEYYDEQSPEKKRRLSPEQVHLLERSFEAENKLEPERKSELARKLGLQPRQVAVWFQNRRARWKTKQLERDFDRLKTSYDSLFADHDALLKDNDRLRAQVVALTEELQAKEVAAGGTALKQGDQVATSVDNADLGVQLKAEDRLSTGSGGSAVLDGREGAVQLVDSSGDSYFNDSYQRGCCVGPVNGGVHSEEDDGSDDGCSYLSGNIFMEEHHMEGDAAAQLGWWVWS